MHKLKHRTTFTWSLRFIHAGILALVLALASDARLAGAQTKSSSSRSTTVKKESAVTTTTPSTLPAAMERVLTAVAGASEWGIRVEDAQSNSVLFEKNATQGFIPASNRKLFTGALALDQLGPDFQYRTYLYRTGPVVNGILDGHLVIRPQGDPTFSNRLWGGTTDDWILKDWVAKVKAGGIREVTGELIIDCSEWDLADLNPKGWPSRVRNDHYAPLPSPLTLKENLLEFRVKPSTAGKPGIIEFIPAASGYPVVNATVTGGSKAKGSIIIKRQPDGKIQISGTATEATGKRTYSVPADNPGLYAAAVFRQHLHNGGVPVRGSLRVLSRKGAVPPPTTDTVLAVYLSPKMSELVSTMMKRSNNHFAEQLYVSIGAVKAGRGGYDATKAIEAEFLRKAGISPGEMRFEDGSGLSEANRVSPRQVCMLLDHMMTHPHGGHFFNSLPVSGHDGTLRGRMRSNSAHERVHAKTGFINSVVCLSGYVRHSPDHTLLFSFLVNDVKTSTASIRSAQDRLCELLCLLLL